MALILELKTLFKDLIMMYIKGKDSFHMDSYSFASVMQHSPDSDKLSIPFIVIISGALTS